MGFDPIDLQLPDGWKRYAMDGFTWHTPKVWAENASRRFNWKKFV
jgi:hypothetical protein